MKIPDMFTEMNHVDSQRPGGKETLDKMKELI